MKKGIIAALVIWAGSFALSPAEGSSIRAQKDELTGFTKYVLIIRSANAVAGDTRASIVVRCSPDESSLYLDTPHYLGIDNNDVFVRWDDGLIVRQYWDLSTDRTAFFTLTPRAFLAKLGVNDSLVLGWKPYSKTRQAARFDLISPRDDINEMTSYCVKGR